MNDRNVTRALVALVAVLAVIAVVVVAYNIGYSAGPNGAAVGPVVGPVVGPAAWHWGMGWWGIGFIFPLLFFLFLFLLIRAAFWGGPRRYGPRYDDDPYRRDAEFEAWHRRAHAQQTEGGDQDRARAADDRDSNR